MAFNVAATVTLRSRHKSSPFWIISLLIAGGSEHHMIARHGQNPGIRDAPIPGCPYEPDADDERRDHFAIGRSAAQSWLELAAHNRLFAGSSPARTTTHSRGCGDFLTAGEIPPNWPGCLRPRGLCREVKRIRGPCRRLSLRPRNPVSRQRRRWRAETRFECVSYGAASPSIWC